MLLGHRVISCASFPLLLLFLIKTAVLNYVHQCWALDKETGALGCRGFGMWAACKYW